MIWILFSMRLLIFFKEFQVWRCGKWKAISFLLFTTAAQIVGKSHQLWKSQRKWSTVQRHLDVAVSKARIFVRLCVKGTTISLLPPCFCCLTRFRCRLLQNRLSSRNGCSVPRACCKWDLPAGWLGLRQAWRWTFYEITSAISDRAAGERAETHEPSDALK